MFRADREEPHSIPEPARHARRPPLKLMSGPLEAVVGVAERPGGQRLPRHVELPVWRRQHDRAVPGELEEHPLERPQPGRVQVFDNLDDGGGIKPVEPLVPVHQRAVDQLHPAGLSLGQPLQLQTAGGDFEGADRHVQTQGFLELPVLEQFPDQLALAAAQVENPLRPARPQCCHDRPEPLVVRADRLLQPLLGQLLFWRLVLFRFLVTDETAEGQLVQARPVAQEPPGDLVLRRVPGQPPLALR